MEIQRRHSASCWRSTELQGQCQLLEIHGVTRAVPVAGDPWSYKGSASCRSTRIVAMAADLQHLTTVSILWDLRRRMFSVGFWRSAAPQGQYQLLEIPGATWAAPAVDPRSHKGSASCWRSLELHGQRQF